MKAAGRMKETWQNCFLTAHLYAKYWFIIPRILGTSDFEHACQTAKTAPNQIWQHNSAVTANIIGCPRAHKAQKHLHVEFLIFH